MLLLGVEGGEFVFRFWQQGRLVESGSFRSSRDMKAKVLALRRERDVRLIGYRVSDGGPHMMQTVMERTVALVARLGETSSASCASDFLMKELIDFLWERCVDSRHFLISDTAFFERLPEYARTFAIPFEKTGQGLRKYGRHGVLHDWGLRTCDRMTGATPGKVITVCLGDRTNIAALRDGDPVAVSNGFCHYDGIMSRTGCGEIDTSIVFQMFAAGESSASIRKVLSRESGFRVLTGGDAGLAKVFSRSDERSRWAQELFSYQLLKWIGAYAAVLGGLDAVLFISESGEALRGWICDFLDRISFLGLAKSPEANTSGQAVLTLPESHARVYFLSCDEWQAMADLVCIEVSRAS